MIFKTRKSAAAICLAAVLFASPVSFAALSDYSQDFENLGLSDPDALANDGWLIFANVFAPDGVSYLYGYGVFAAPNGSGGFSSVADGQGGPAQGAQQLVIFNDYNNADHGNGNRIEANVFTEQTISAEDVGKTYVFRYDAKRGDIAGASTAIAFFKTLDPNAGFATTNFITNDTTSLPTSWGTYELQITIDQSLVGQLLQFGFSTTASNFEASGNFYDNVFAFFFTDSDGDQVADAVDNCVDLANADQLDYDSDGVGDVCDPSRYADITTFGDVTGDLVPVPDLAGFVGESNGTPSIIVYSGATGDAYSTIDYLNELWHGFALSTVRDSNQDGTADDPAGAMLAVNRTTLKIRVETRNLSTGASLGPSIQFFNENWRAIDVVVVDDLNGDGNTDDSAVAVLAERISDGRVQVQLRDLATGALISNTVYLNARWTPIAAAVADRSGIAPAGTLAPVIGVIAENSENNKRIMQTRVAGAGSFDQNIKFLGSTWNYQDVSVNYDAVDNPIWQVLAVRPSDNVIRVQSRFVADGAFDDNSAILNANWESFRMDSATDMGGGAAGELVISAIRRADGVRRIHVTDYGSGGTTINIAP